MNVYKVTYDIKVGRTWLAEGNVLGWSSRYVLGSPDVRSACDKLEKEEKKITYDGRRVSAVRILHVEQVATNVLC